MFVGHEDATVANFQNILVPGSYTASALGNTRNSLRASPTFQLFIHVTKTTNLWSQQRSFSWSDIYIATNC